MTIPATCPKGHTLTVENKLAGKKIRCPRCQAVFEVPDLDDDYDDEDDEEEAISEKPLKKGRRRCRDDDDDDDDRPRGKSRAAAARDDADDDEEEMDPEERRKLEKREKKKALKLVDVGLLLHYIKLMIYVIGMLFGIAVLILFVIAAAQTTQAVADAGATGGGEAVQPGGGFVLFGAVTIFVALIFLLRLAMGLVAPLLGIVGSFLCCWVPKKSQARGTIVISLTFDLISIVCWLLAVLADFGVFGMETHKTVNLMYLLQCINAFCIITSWLTFLTFLRTAGAYLGEPSLGNEALNLIARLVVQVISLIFNIMANIALAIMIGGIFAIIGMIIVVLIWFVFFVFGFYIRMLKLVGAMRQAVQNKL